MAEEITNEQIAQIAQESGYSIEEIRDAATETEWIARLRKEYPHCTLHEILRGIALDKGFIYY